VAWDVREYEVFRADELNRGPFEHGVVLFTDEARVLYGFLNDIVYVCFCADYPNVVFVCLVGVQCNV
jgi:hypothetical protein